ncbi:hypothetical protein [Halopiger djelfimassiliensis]|uniref:hypothetical protein n=1 Tax=Halopiger djelfimassiliensis TaxID=1293047 RepID=UPI0006776277|nr:hypothetical protein [Halopiger djelfimassiliensis]
MSTDPTVTEVFEDVDADPDAVLAAHDVDSPADLVAAGGDHDPGTDAAVDADDLTAAELFADLASLSPDAERADAIGDERETADGGPALPDETVFVAEPSVTVRPDDPALEAITFETDGRSRSESTTGPELVGPDPTPTRIENDAFGGAVDTDDGTDFRWAEDDHSRD